MIVNYSNNGICSKCGKCCLSPIPCSDKEKNRIIDLVRRKGIRAEKPHEGEERTCPFLMPTSWDKDKVARGPFVCSVYDVRPAFCRRFNCISCDADNRAYDGLPLVDFWDTRIYYKR